MDIDRPWEPLRKEWEERSDLEMLIARLSRPDVPACSLSDRDRSRWSRTISHDVDGIILFTNMSMESPNEIYFSHVHMCKGDNTDVHGKPCYASVTTPEELTHLNESVLGEVAMSPLEPFWFEGAHGDEVEGFLVKPPNFDPSKKYPVKFLIHGGPEGAWGDDWSYRWNPELFAANGYVVIMINFHGSTGYGQKFIDAINGDWGGAPFEDLMKGLDYAEKTLSVY